MFEQCCRMGCSMDLLQGSDGNLGIDLRGLEVLVSEHLLDEPDVGSPSCISVAIVCRNSG